MKGEMAVSPDGKRVRFSKRCSVTGERYEVEISMAQFTLWRNGGMIQDVCHELSPDQREFLINGLTPAEWSDLMGDEG